MFSMRNDSLPYNYRETVNSISERFRNAALPYYTEAPTLFSNPALQKFKLPFSLSAISLSFKRDSKPKSLAPFEGEGEGTAGIETKAYIHSRSAVIFGEASYRNGTLFNLQWNEQGNDDIFHPYIIADATGGNLREEQYEFSAGYNILSGKFSWGISGGYLATLSYRQVDPRPKTSLGDLFVDLGFGYKFRDNLIAACAAGFEKIRSHTEISFVNELGQSKIYHLTGLGTHYNRFVGSGSNVYNDLYNFKGSLNLLSISNSGPFFTIDGEWGMCKNVIVDLNRIPLATLKNEKLSMQLGWRSKQSAIVWGSDATVSLNIRRGYEGIFGDPLSSSFPKIGELEMYFSHNQSWVLHGFVEFHNPRYLPFLSASLDFTRRKDTYQEPFRQFLAQGLSANLIAGASVMFANKHLLSVKIELLKKWAFSNYIIFNNPETVDWEVISLENNTLRYIESQQSDYYGVKFSPSFLYSISASYALDLSLIAGIYHIDSFGNVRNITASLSFFF